MTNKEKGIMIFKDTFEYLMDGDLTSEQFAELMKLIYQLRWGDGVDDSKIMDKEVKLIWKTLRHTVQKSKTNARQYQKKNIDIQPNTEFEEAPEEEVKIPSVQKDKEDDRAELYERAVDGVINELINIVASGKGFDVYEERLSEHSTVISTEYNIPFKEVKNTINKKAKNIYMSQNNIKIAN
jgi:hypothetical protein